MNPTDMPLARRMAITTATLTALAVGLALLLGPSSDGDAITVTAEFGRAGQGLATSSSVKMRGVTVGRVAAIKLGERDRVRITLHINDGVRVPDSVTASIEPLSVFGPKFVNLIPGDHEATGPYLAEGAQIARTADPKDIAAIFGDANRTVAALDPGDLSTIVHVIAQGLDGTGPQLGRLIDNSGALISGAHRHRQDMRQVLHDTALLSNALHGTGDHLVGIIGDANALTTLITTKRDRIGPLADGMAQLTGKVAHGLDLYGPGLGALVNSGERAAAVLYAQLGVGGDGVRALNKILTVVEPITGIHGSGGKNMVGAQFFLPSSPCELIVGLCGPAKRD